MKIWIAITNLQGGGAERSMLNTASGLTRRGHQVRFILLEDRIDHVLPAGVEPILIGRPGRRISKGWIGKRRTAWRLRRWMRDRLRSEQPDLIISTLPFTDEIVRIAGMQDVWFRITNTLSEEIEKLRTISVRKSRWRLARYRRIYSGQNIIAVSQGVADDMRDRIGISDANIVTVYNPFDLDKIRNLSAAATDTLPGEPFIIHAGRFVPQKRHDLLFEAFVASGVPHRLVLLTKPTRKLRALIASYGLTDRVTIAGFATNPFPWYARAAAMVLSSDFEGFPNVLVEALACGTPVVSTDCPSGPREILSGNLQQYLSPVGDAAALARNLASVIASPPAINSGTVSRFSEDELLTAIEKLSAPGGLISAQERLLGLCLSRRTLLASRYLRFRIENSTSFLCFPIWGPAARSVLRASSPMHGRNKASVSAS
jgi:glycosyltransferase involved in cell wall biosynthesis